MPVYNYVTAACYGFITAYAGYAAIMNVFDVDLACEILMLLLITIILLYQLMQLFIVGPALTNLIMFLF